MSGTMAEKVWRDHIVSKGENGAPDLLYLLARQRRSRA